VFTILGNAKINVDIIIQSVGKNNTNDISFTVAAGDAATAVDAISAYKDAIGFHAISVDDDIAKVSIVGAGMISSPASPP
jgi:aspartate kinase